MIYYFSVLQCLGPDVPWAEIRTVDGNQIGKFFLTTKDNQTFSNFLLKFSFHTNTVLKSEIDKKLEELVQNRAYPQVRNMRFNLEHNSCEYFKFY